MFDVGFTELMLIGIVALVVMGPERLPAVAKTAGLWIGKAQRFVRGVKTDLASELESGDLKKLIGDQREQINELKQMVSTATKDFESSTKDVVQGAKKSIAAMESSTKNLDGVSDEPEPPVAGSSESGDAKPDGSSLQGQADEKNNTRSRSDMADSGAPEDVAHDAVPGKSQASRSQSTWRSSSEVDPLDGVSSESANVNRTGTDSAS